MTATRRRFAPAAQQVAVAHPPKCSCCLKTATLCGWCGSNRFYLFPALYFQRTEPEQMVNSHKQDRTKKKSHFPKCHVFIKNKQLPSQVIISVMTHLTGICRDGQQSMLPLVNGTNHDSACPRLGKKARTARGLECMSIPKSIPHYTANKPRPC